ncbi:hypothetical protein ZHAS_00005925 [Anopheles sinensis]|uniref:Uncharacterized protein n=1 Tax=Anopheles sinensis TaxID=74873 RepID=A0A084VKM3_ANOSI|nr:hypothetical protein ZHAS_00005925 [Anopheles sinensis]
MVRGGSSEQMDEGPMPDPDRCRPDPDYDPMCQVMPYARLPPISGAVLYVSCDKWMFDE